MSQVTLLKSDGPAGSAGTSLAAETPTETGTWTEVPNITAAIPVGGALLRVVANSAAMRVAVLSNGRAVPPTPPHNGLALALGATHTRVIDPSTRVFTRTL
jgi:hypothetical protein